MRTRSPVPQPASRHDLGSLLRRPVVRMPAGGVRSPTAEWRGTCRRSRRWCGSPLFGERLLQERLSRVQRCQHHSAAAMCDVSKPRMFSRAGPAVEQTVCQVSRCAATGVLAGSRTRLSGLWVSGWYAPMLVVAGGCYRRVVWPVCRGGRGGQLLVVGPVELVIDPVGVGE